MHWLRLIIETTADRVDALAALLEQFDACSISFQPVSREPLFDHERCADPVWWQRTSVTALLAGDIDLDILLACIRNRVGTEHIHGHRIDSVSDAGWDEAYKREFRTMCFADALVIRPAWEPETDPRLPTLVLEPGLAFGTGKHATTALCLEWLARNNLEGKTLIDYGCGSGILGLAAARLGAALVYAVDSDPQALQAARHNAEINRLQARVRICPPAETLPPASVLIANILFNPLQELAPRFSQLVVPGGSLVLSGILAHQAHDCLTCYSRWFSMGEPVYRDEWTLLQGCR
jgi:ribosomal protein L11 methyltransferase